MFVTNGSRKPKPIFVKEVSYPDNPSSISEFSGKRTVVPNSNAFKNLFNSLPSKFKAHSKIKEEAEFNRFISRKECLTLIKLSMEYNAKIVVFTCFEKKTKKLRISFYIIPHEAIAKIEEKDSGLFSNKRIYLKSNYVFPSILVGSPYRKEHIEKSLNFSNHKLLSSEKTSEEYTKNFICIKESRSLILRDKIIYLNKKDFPCSDNYKVLLDGVSYLLHVDKDKFGTKESPFYFLYNSTLKNF